MPKDETHFQQQTRKPQIKLEQSAPIFQKGFGEVDPMINHFAAFATPFVPLHVNIVRHISGNTRNEHWQRYQNADLAKRENHIRPKKQF